MWWPFFTIVGTRCLPARSLWPLCFRNRTGQKTRNRTTGPSVYYGPPKKADNIVGGKDPERAGLDEDQDRDTGTQEQGLDGAQEARGISGLGERHPRLRRGGPRRACYRRGR